MTEVEAIAGNAEGIQAQPLQRAARRKKAMFKPGNDIFIVSFLIFLFACAYQLFPRGRFSQQKQGKAPESPAMSSLSSDIGSVTAETVEGSQQEM
eukprot:TRINITY_DN25234_c0_g1_i2.p1 TRINITY_DN25234_c0_g1~~TRINITY_DN25234_c0_g1_i2.p1  ORF type:complete len:111 (-),score=10.48 TRINITY_DN25234_c0_g1_i2:86-370(-)